MPCDLKSTARRRRFCAALLLGLLVGAAQVDLTTSLSTVNRGRRAEEQQRSRTWSSSGSSNGREAGRYSDAPAAGALQNERRRQLEPPFPDGLCGGKLISLSQEEIFGVNTNSFLLPPRPIEVWLPPGYNAASRYPVLYCHDGQNAMQDAASWTGQSWRLAGALTRMQEYDLLSTTNIPIVVMLHAAVGDVVPGVRRRHLEYGELNGQPTRFFAEAHADFVAKTVKPAVDAMFSTYSSPQDTAAIGTSMGGQASLNLLFRHPNVFGSAACLSPYFGPTTLALAQTNCTILQQKKVYMDIGGDFDKIKVPLVDVWDHLTPNHWWNPGYFWLDTQLQQSVQNMKRICEEAGVPVAYHEFPGARHNERAWSQRIHRPLLHLYGKNKESE